MTRWEPYLFETHPEDTLRSWARRLRFFRFFRAYGGHANDGDSLDVVYRYDSLQTLESFLGELGVPLVKYTEHPPRPERGVSYSGEELATFASLIAGTKWVRQPGSSVISGQKVFIWCEDDLVKISVGEAYQVTEEDVVSAEVIERLLLRSCLERVDPPFDTEHYVCPKYYPEYFL
jgi:hypothetical protein